MNNSYLERAKKVVSDPKILSLITAKRARQLALGMRPMVKCKAENWVDVALLEIAEGKLSYEFSDLPEEDIFAQTTSDTDAETASLFAQQIVGELEDNDTVMSDEEYFQSEAENEASFGDIFDEEDDSEAYRQSMKDDK